MIKTLKYKALIALTITSMQVSAKEVSFNAEQLKIMNIGFTVGKLIKADNGITFGKTGATLPLTESSAGVNIIGDIKKDAGKVDLSKCSLGPFQIQPRTAKFIIKKDKFLFSQFHMYLKDDKKLINKLLTSPKFGALIALSYFKHNYNIALKRGYKNPLSSGFATYNGGWVNKPYVKRSYKNMRLVNKLIKKGIIKDSYNKM
jgi:hypothetical protein